MTVHCQRFVAGRSALAVAVIAEEVLRCHLQLAAAGTEPLPEELDHQFEHGAEYSLAW